MLQSENTVFVFIDMQGKLATLVHEHEVLFDNLKRLIKGMHALDIPIIWTEQNPTKVGGTLPEFVDLLKPARPISKMSFSCCGNETFMTLLTKLNRKQVVVAGIETHVCVYQTVGDLVRDDYEVEVVADAVSSRCDWNKQVALQKMRTYGAHLTTAEMVLFELMQTAEHPAFRDILKVVK